MLTRLLSAAALLIGLLCAVALAEAQEVRVCSPANPCTIQWNPNQESDIREYRVLLSQVSGQYDVTHPAAVIAHPATTRSTTGIGALSEGRYFVAVVAVDRSGNVSGLSNEVEFLFDGPPGAPVIQLIQVTIP